jgi:hypothetical protein
LLGVFEIHRKIIESVEFEQRLEALELRAQQ